MNQLDRPWSLPVTVAEIPDGGSHYNLVADASTRDAVMKLARVRTLSRLEASFDLTRRGEAVAVRGEVKAQVGQTCVVTLEPIESAVHEQIDLLFAPAESETGDIKQTKKKGEPPEPLENGVVDIGAIATEFLVLGLDPYPRKAGVEFERLEVGEKSSHPFAALADLKKRP
jgi:uncharacterized metal-binding protein YceD (DUF177 family)